MFELPWENVQLKGVSFQVSEILARPCVTRLISKERVFIGTFAGESVAVKKLSLSSNIHRDEQHWDKLIKLRDDNLVQYYLCGVENNIRYLVMELCQGSLLDYCRKTLDVDVASNINAIDVIWQITYGLDFLQRNKIDHGDLKLENVLFWKRDSKSKRVVVKLTGYGYNYHLFEKHIKTDVVQFGCLFYSAATKNEAEPQWPIAFDSLTEIDANNRFVVLHLINFLINDSPKRFEMKTLLRHPLFTQCNEDARSKLINEMMGIEMGHVWKDVQKLQEWRNIVDHKNFLDENFEDLKKILLSFDNTSKIMHEAFKTTPKLFADYIWYLATVDNTITPMDYTDNDKIQPIETQNVSGEGTYGTVIEREGIDRNGGINRRQAAFKKFKRNLNLEIEEKFDIEIETLCQLNHLHVIKYSDVVVENDSEKYIDTELFDGSLKEYVEGKLEGIPKDSLDEKILIGQIALGLAYIHGKGIIHKDLTLENILLKRQSPRLVLAKIAEFGFAKQLKQDTSEFSQSPSTEKYLAPELLNGTNPATFASDAYALGIIIAQIVLKEERHPFSPNGIWRKVSNVKGLVPQNPQGLSWDLSDLNLKLTDKDPGKRPNMVLVLNHPYFVLTNERTKKHFVDQLWDRFNLLSNHDRSKQMKKLLNIQNFQGWYHSLSGEKPATEEEMEEISNTLQFLQNLNQENYEPNIKAEILSPVKKYEQMTNKESFETEYDPDVENQINQMIFISLLRTRFRGLSRCCLDKLIQRSPNLLVPYIWSTNLHDIVNDPQSGPFVTPISPGSGTEPKQTITSELEWSSLYLDKEVVDELWNMKYSENYKNSPETIEEIIQTVVTCNISEKVWSDLLDNIGIQYGISLLYKVVKSHSPNAPKFAKIIMQRLDVNDIPAQIYILVASNEGDWAADILQVLLNHGVDPSNAVSSIGMTPVHYAAQNESSSGPKLMKLLLENGGDPNTRSTGFEKSTPVHLAASNQGDYAAEILKLLLDNGGACDTRDGQFEPIHLAMMNNSDSAPQLMELLLKKRGINVINRRTGMPLVHFAVFINGNSGPKIVQTLLENGANPNTCDKRKQTPLHLAARDIIGENNQIAIMKAFLENGGDPNAVDELGKTPVHYAAINEGEYAHEKLKLLLTHGGMWGIEDQNSSTPVTYPMMNNGFSGKEIRKSVNEKQLTNFSLDNKRGEEDLPRRLVNGNKNPVHRGALDNGKNANDIDDSLDSLPNIHVVVTENASSSFGFDIVELWLKNGGDPNLLDNENRYTLIHYAASSLKEWGPMQMEILLGNGGNANAIGKEGYTPLHLAAMNSGINGPKLTRMLLEHGADPKAMDNFGRSAVHAAVLNENDQIASKTIFQLLKHGGNANANDKKGRTPLHYAITEKPYSSLIGVLLQYGGNILERDNHGMTPLRLHMNKTRKYIEF